MMERVVTVLVQFGIMGLLLPFPTAYRIPEPKSLLVNCISAGSTGLDFQHRLKWRTNAEDQATIWLFGGEQLKIHFFLESNAAVEVLDVRYSNDGGVDDISVFLDDQKLGDFKTQEQHAWGNQWNNLRSSGPVGYPRYVHSGEHSVTLSVENSDMYGVEIDYIRLNVHGSKVENLKNEQFFCEHNPNAITRH